MEEGGGHGFFVLVVVLGGGGGGGCCFFLLVVFVVCFSFGWLVGWLGGFSFLVSCSREVIFLYQFSPIMQNVDMLFSSFSFFLSFFWLSWRGGWIMHLRVEPID